MRENKANCKIAWVFFRLYIWNRIQYELEIYFSIWKAWTQIVSDTLTFTVYAINKKTFLWFCWHSIRFFFVHSTFFSFCCHFKWILKIDIVTHQMKLCSRRVLVEAFPYLEVHKIWLIFILSMWKKAAYYFQFNRNRCANLHSFYTFS